jgi:hypothetical protein
MTMNTQNAGWHGLSPAPGMRVCTCPKAPCGGAIVAAGCHYHDECPAAQTAHEAAACPGPPVSRRPRWRNLPIPRGLFHRMHPRHASR